MALARRSPTTILLHRFVRPLCLATLFALAGPVSLLPVQGRTGRIRGVVIDSLLGATLPDTEVRVARLNRTAVTNSTGRFVLDTVPPGEWTVASRRPHAVQLPEPL
ncbi:MAG: hypothetical protein C0497_13220 [Gemmatimonas sp.]|nr:hypothetical protein [Gemmatimonas sp.]